MLEASYGTWDSPVTTEWVTHGQKRFGNIVLDGEVIYWDEMRPTEGGRSVIVRRTKEGKIEDVLPEPFNARTRVHEYGGAPFTVYKGTIYFVNDKDQRIYVKDKPLTEAGVRFADLQATETHLYAVGEIKRDNFLAVIDLKTGKYEKIATGHDFYGSPTLSPDKTKLAFLTWDVPQMPWDGTDLWVMNLADRKIEHIAGGPEESIFQPQWAADGTLYFVSDRTGWWNLYTLKGPVCPLDAEFGLPQWVFGMSTYAILPDKIIAAYHQSGKWSLGTISPLQPLDLPYTFFSQIRAADNFVAMIAGSPTEGRSVVRLDLSTLKPQVLAHNIKPQTDIYSIPEFISFPSKNGRTAYAFYYPPYNPNFRGPKGELPPLIVMSHGGPTAASDSTFNIRTQYWTSRGFALLDVNYGGSTGYGRPYRDLLKANWGIVDQEDCEAGAEYLVQKGLVDPKRLAITGGSAGGYTTLCALTFGKLFNVGASYFGVSDIAALATDTHKFEDHYMGQLVPADQFTARSPICFPEKLHCPVIFFQGAEDKVVPPDQAEKMYQALRSKGITTDLIIYPEEQHGFRKAENIKDSLEREHAFYLQTWEKK